MLTLRNDGDTSVVVQVTTVAWSQDAQTGEDRYEETHEILATPPVFEVAAHAEQIVGDAGLGHLYGRDGLPACDPDQVLAPLGDQSAEG